MPGVTPAATPMSDVTPSDRLRIGVVCYPTYGGSGVVATELGLGMARHGHQVHFITYRQPARLRGYAENVYYHEVSSVDYPLFEYTPYDTALASKLVEVVKRERLDLLHVHYAIPHATVAFLAREILKSQGLCVPFVTTLHGTDITLVGQTPSFSPVVQFGINSSDGVTAVSASLREDTLASFGVSRPIEVVPNFIDLDRFRKVDKGHFKLAIAPGGECILTHVSNFRGVKRVDDVVRIFKKVHEQLPSKLLLIGDGPERYKAEELVREFGLTADVRFLGKQDAIEELLAISDVFLMPSEKESFGLAALEAMACQVPVISSDAGGLSEVNVHGQTGYLSKVGDVDDMAANTLKIVRDPDVLASFRQRAFAQAKRFDIEVVLPQYEAVYRAVLCPENAARIAAAAETSAAA